MTRLTGGCQCGAVRFAIDPAAVSGASICHCRMCQKAFGGYYAPLVNVAPEGLEWTRGAPARWRSSNLVRRGFCVACGTPLTYEPDGENPAIAAGAFDDPSAVPPTIQYGTEGELAFVPRLHELPGRTTEDTVASAEWIGRIVSHQHPDHDTDRWPEARP
jgi:hypothetical protein